MSEVRIQQVLADAVRRREPLVRTTNAVRLFNSSGDGIPGLIIDRFNRHIAIQQLRSGDDDRVLDAVVAWVISELDPAYCILKERAGALSSAAERAFATRVICERESSKTVVTENGLSFEIDVNDAFNAGLFMDMRATRKEIAARSSGKDVLNCFSYTCSFGVYCRAAGAARVVNVDINKKCLEWGRRNYALNRIQPAPDEFKRAPCREYLAGAVKWKNYFDCIIIDPPTFARYDRKIFKVQQEMPQLIDDACAILKPEGTLVVATNCSDIMCEDLEDCVADVARDHGRRIRSCTRIRQDSDFPGTNTMRESYLAGLIVGM